MPIEFVLTVNGYSRISNDLRKLARQAPDVIDREVKRYGAEMVTMLRGKAYPPERAGQRYVRTGRLKRSWLMVYSGKGRIQIVNYAAQRGKRYARYVVGDMAGEGQAWMHTGRWWLASETIAKDSRSKMLGKEIRKELIDVLGWRATGGDAGARSVLGDFRAASTVTPTSSWRTW